MRDEDNCDIYVTLQDLRLCVWNIQSDPEKVDKDSSRVKKEKGVAVDRDRDREDSTHNEKSEKK